MKNLKTKIMSTAMAGAMALTMAVPALAANEVVINGVYEQPTIAVTVPTEALKAVINPYGLGVSVEKSGGSKVSMSGQITSVPGAIKNQSGMNLSVGAQVTGEVVYADGVTATTGLKLATSTTKGTGSEGDDDYVAPATGKSAFVYLQMASVSGATGDDEDAVDDAVIDAAAAWDDDYNAEKNPVVTAGKTTSATDLVTLAAATVDADDGSFTSYNAGSVAMFRLSGDCVEAPKNAWAATDTFTATVAFTFTPVAATAP